ncbi:MAG TPA: DNA mismatch repair protein MutS [Gemmatimonadaceae bacterium]|nr:DNA mismatch repair protein MutS [Gemmatimonadaceae bacterium]
MSPHPVSATPLMQQYREIKARHQDAILFFRMGDFYEMFYDDAETASRVLGLTLTSRNNGGAARVPLAGVPVKAVNEYLRRLVAQGFRVTICEQVEDPKLAKGLVRREVVETITPGAVFADDLLDGVRNNFLCALHQAGDAVGMAAADLSTGEFRLIRTTPADLEAVLARLAPGEMLVTRGAPPHHAIAARGEENTLITEREAWEFDAALASEELSRQFGVASLEGFGVGAEDTVAVSAAGALVRYLRELQPGGVPHLARPVVERPGNVMPLDEMTRRNLELVESLRGGETSGTLLDVLDRTMTPMGARALRQWILAPLSSRAAIEARLDAVEALARDALARPALRSALDGVRDVERLASKAAAGRATPRELGALGASLARLPAVEEAARRVAGGVEARSARAAADGAAADDVEEHAGDRSSGAIDDCLVHWDSCADLARDIAHTLVEHPPLAIGDERTIADGVDEELDALRALRDGGKDGIARIQAAERARTGITSLKVGYNRVFGYYIEVTNANRHLIPPDYQRRQTLTGAERYVTPELKEYEDQVLTAAERIEARERALFEALRARVGAAIARLQRVAGVVAQLDVLSTLAEVAEREGYVRPEMTDEFALEIVGGRHPVVERMMPREQFIPNDVRLTEDARMIILTGPNMAGKSTILRQIGLIVLMAQTGGFVPAVRARLGVVDRVFTRVGASDNLVRGQSTFMVEMSETSAILHTATRRSLVLLDEIGRGTSTYDGVSIAWAVSEHLHTVTGCKAVFATHYHELTQLADELEAIRNYNVAVREVGERVLFLHTLEPGGADRSYGIEVGRLAGLPEPVIARARELLHQLEGRRKANGERREAKGERRDEREERREVDGQLGLFAWAPDPVVERLREVDPNLVTPMQALQLLMELAEELERRG